MAIKYIEEAIISRFKFNDGEINFQKVATAERWAIFELTSESVIRVRVGKMDLVKGWESSRTQLQVGKKVKSSAD